MRIYIEKELTQVYLPRAQLAALLAQVTQLQCHHKHLLLLTNQSIIPNIPYPAENNSNNPKASSIRNFAKVKLHCVSETEL
jgi:hypothetical protein